MTWSSTARCAYFPSRPVTNRPRISRDGRRARQLWAGRRAGRRVARRYRRRHHRLSEGDARRLRVVRDRNSRNRVDERCVDVWTAAVSDTRPHYGVTVVMASLSINRGYRSGLAIWPVRLLPIDATVSSIIGARTAVAAPTRLPPLPDLRRCTRRAEQSQPACA